MKAIKTIEKLDATVTIPGSKSFTQRALIIASLAKGQSFLRNALISEDTMYLIDALRMLGAVILISKEDIIVSGTDGIPQNPGKRIYVSNNGTALRFLTTLASLGRGPFMIDGTERLRQRPIQPLIDALRSLGVRCYSAHGTGYPPVTVEGGNFEGGSVTCTNIESSQYISSLLIGAPRARRDVTILMRGVNVSLPYIDMTIAVMSHFGVSVVIKNNTEYFIRTPQSYKGRKYIIESDASSASYFLLAAALCRGKVRILNINPHTLQGDIGFVDILEEIGCHVERGHNYIEVVGRKPERGDMVFNMAHMPDMVPSLAVLSALRPGRTKIIGVPHLRIKESNRIASLVAELNRIGIPTHAMPDGLVINGGKPPHGDEIETYEDHRIAMSFAVAGLVVKGITIKNEDCVAKSFPDFWHTLDGLYT